MNKPLISIIIPVYNTDIDLIHRCVKSIECQDYDNYEILIVFNGCAQDYIQSVNKILSSFSCVKSLECDTKGVSAARNLGILESSGEYIAFVDADDEVENRYLSEAYDLITKLDVDIVSGAIDFIYKDSNEIMSVKADSPCIYDNISIMGHTLVYYMSFETPELSEYLFSSPCSKLYKASMVKQCYFSTEIRHREDLVFNYMVLSKCNRIAIVPNVWYKYYQYGSSAIHTYSNMLNNDLALMKEVHGVESTMWENNWPRPAKIMYAAFCFDLICELARYMGYLKWKNVIKDSQNELFYKTFYSEIINSSDMEDFDRIRVKRLKRKLFVSGQWLILYCYCSVTPILKKLSKRNRRRTI